MARDIFYAFCNVSKILDVYHFVYIYPELANEFAKEPLPNGVPIEPALDPLLAKDPPPYPGYVLPPHPPPHPP